MINLLLKALVLALVLVVPAVADEAFPPHRVVGNVYYVGSKELATYLITTVVVIGSPNVNPGYQLVENNDYPEIAADFAKTFQVLKSLPCDIFLGAHGEYYGMIAKHERLKTTDKNPFLDSDGYREYVDVKEKAFRKTLHAQSQK